MTSRPPRRAAPLIVALALCLTLTGCLPAVSPTHPATSPPADSPATELPFASDEEALAAAEKVYREYLRIVDNGADTEQLSAVATADLVQRERETTARLAADGITLSGLTALTSFTLQARYGGDLVAYACLDLSQLRTLDSEGQDVTPASRARTGLFEVQLEFVERQFFVAETDLWSTSC